MEKTITLRPRVSEKTYGLSESQNVYVFEVPRDVNKQTIANAVTAQFDVKVLNVNVTNLKGKSKRTNRKGGRPVAGKQNDVKKAYVTLAEGNSIALFKSNEEPAAKPETSTKRGKK